MSLPLQPFKGHIFNILFQNDACIYFLHPHMIEFLEKSEIWGKQKTFKICSFGSSCLLLCCWTESVGFDFKDGYNALVESSWEQGHVNWRHDATLSPYLVDACENVVDFMKGTFPSLRGVVFYGDRIFESLTKESTYDTDVEIILRVMLPSIRKVVLHVYKDHLPNGRYESFTEELSLATKNVDKHNSYSERRFAYMDQILK